MAEKEVVKKDKDEVLSNDQKKELVRAGRVNLSEKNIKVLKNPENVRYVLNNSSVPVYVPSLKLYVSPSELLDLQIVCQKPLEEILRDRNLITALEKKLLIGLEKIEDLEKMKVVSSESILEKVKKDATKRDDIEGKEVYVEELTDTKNPFNKQLDEIKKKEELEEEKIRKKKK